MENLLDAKDNCEEFVTTLKGTGDRNIVHNVAFQKWGTGGGSRGGDNLFGHLLMKKRANLNG